MASLREYFDNDFNSAARVYVRLQGVELQNVDVALLYDFSAFAGFLACYVKGSALPLEYYLRLIEAMQHGKSQVTLDGKVVLPAGRSFPGRLEIVNQDTFLLRAQFHGDPEWVSTADILVSNRIFIYSETQLDASEFSRLKDKGRQLGQHLQFRSLNHAIARSKAETPLAFVSHDSRDKATVATKIASGLQRLMCPVWYDEYSLKVGDNLRDSIESGLKTCRKCILVLSPNFLSNGGWTKREFDSIFTREILERQQLVLPVWCGVTKKEVFDYSPSLLNIKGLDWQQLGEIEVCRLLTRAILYQES